MRSAASSITTLDAWFSRQGCRRRVARPARCTGRAAIIEVLERRQLLATITDSGCVHEISNLFDRGGYLAQLSYGGNGDPWGPGEAAAGMPDYGNWTRTNIEWDPDPSDGLDTGSRAVSLSFQAGDSGMVWTVDGQEIALDVGPTSVSTVFIQAVVGSQTGSPTAMLWQSATVSFCKDGALTDIASLGNFGPDQLQIQVPTSTEQLITVTPANPDNDKSSRARSGSRPPKELIRPQTIYTATC